AGVQQNYIKSAGVQQNYIKSTSKLHHFYVRSRVYNRITSKVHHFYIIFTSDLTSELFVHPPPLPGPPARAENGFSGCAGNASRPRNKLGSFAGGGGILR
ncbi:hypothetical protein, partial [Escherichia coli]|uniref:hypothetical protein n=1 Tax=Escherichia coli TaxID=562 RepID=UPI003D7BF84A